jgi:hypothetical protein
VLMVKDRERCGLKGYRGEERKGEERRGGG